MIHSPVLLEHAYEQLKPVSIDYAVMEGAARDHRVVMARDGRRLVRHWGLVRASRGDRGRREGAVVQQGRAVEASMRTTSSSGGWTGGGLARPMERR